MRALPFRQSLEGWQAVRDVMESLLVDGVDRHLRPAKKAWIVERADFQDHGVETRAAREQMRAAFGAKFPRHGAFEIAARKLPGRPRGVTEAIGRHEHEHVRRAATDILAFAAVALRLEHRLALGHIAHLAAIAPAFQLHGILPVSLSFITATPAMWTSAAAGARRDGVDPVVLHRFVSGKIDRNVHGRRQPGELLPEVELGRGLLEPGENDLESST